MSAIAVAATFTAEPLAEPLRFWCGKLGWPDEVVLAPYNQVLRLLADPAGLFLSGRSAACVIVLRHEDGLRFAGGEGEQEREREEAGERARDQDLEPHQEPGRVGRILRERTRELIAAIERALAVASAPFVIVVGPPSAARAADPGFAALFDDLDRDLERGLGERAGAVVVPWRTLRDRYPCDDALDAHADRLGHVPYTDELYAVLATAIARALYALRTTPRKAIVLDCDGTLWRGVVGEDGPDGAVVDDAGRALQAFMAARKQEGFLLALLSHNVEGDVWARIDLGRGMLLARDDFAAWRIDWQPKSEGLRALARELGVGLDSLVFIDDDPVQCAEARARCPEVATLELPREPARVAEHLEHVWAFDRPRLTAEDRERPGQYRLARARDQARLGATSLGDFLAALDLRVDVTEAGAADLARLAQLTQRTNQLNLTTIRRGEAELRHLVADGRHRALAVRVADRFGHYGLVGAIVYRVEAEAGRLDVDTFLLSCRVLGRGVEHRMLARLGALAVASGVDAVRLVCRPSPRNQPARELCEATVGAYRRPAAGDSGASDGAVEYLVPAGVAAAIEVPVDAPARPAPAESAEGVESSRAASGLPHPAAPGGLGVSALLAEVAALRTGRLILEAVRAARPAPAGAAGGADVAPSFAAEPRYRDAVEGEVARLIGGVLGVGPVAPHANFYELGGDSLMGIQLLGSIARAFGAELPMEALFPDACSVEGLADAVRARRPAASTAGAAGRPS